MLTLGRDSRGAVLSGAALDHPLRVAAVNGHALEQRAARLAARSIKRESKRAGLELAVRCIDLTTLEGADTPGKVRALCARALRPDPDDPSLAPVAAVCVYGSLVAEAHAALEGTTVRVASVAGAFPSGPEPPGAAPRGDPAGGGGRRRRGGHRPQPRGAAGGAPGRGARRGGRLQGGLRAAPT